MQFAKTTLSSPFNVMLTMGENIRLESFSISNVHHTTELTKCRKNKFDYLLDSTVSTANIFFSISPICNFSIPQRGNIEQLCIKSLYSVPIKLLLHLSQYGRSECICFKNRSTMFVASQKHQFSCKTFLYATTVKKLMISHVASNDVYSIVLLQKLDTVWQTVTICFLSFNQITRVFFY